MRIEIEIQQWPLEDLRAEVLLLHADSARVAVVGLALSSLVTVGLLCGGVLRETDSLIVLATMPAVLAFYYACVRFYLLPHRIPRKIARRMAELGSIRIVIDENGILEEAAAAEAFHRWEAVTKYQEHRGGLLIYFIGGVSLYLPRWCLTAQEILELRKKLAELR